MQCARQGFALGLTVLIGVIPSIKVDSLLKLVVDLLEVNSSMKGQVGETLSVCLIYPCQFCLSSYFSLI